ncbi:MAG: heavy-metal-associated domain-containing protein [Methylococcaceae bacterium]
MIEKRVFNVTGMKCGGCENNVSEKLTALDGVISVTASSKENQVSVEFDNEQLDVDAIEEVITAAGFHVEEDE